MAAKKSKKVKLPPKFARVIVATALASQEARARFFAKMQDLEESGIVKQVMRYVHAERGVWLREGASWPLSIRRIAELEFRLADLVAQLMGDIRSVSWDGLPAHVRPAFEATALQTAQKLMDAVFDSGKDWHSRRVDVLAGLTPPCADLAKWRAASGVEVASNLGWCIRQAVAGIGSSPFLLYAVSSQMKRAMRKQVGRPAPRAAGELQADDVAILGACKGGPLHAKEVAVAAVVAGGALSESHCSKRKKDLKTWGLLTGARQFVLSELGRSWLTELQADA
ncbi:MAG: hypothetical protein MUC36_03030 [Planctomycetes bacterium]|jgi:hypothetical protein|nr:hypothetical protein [Planctomycetota bacterium]